MTRPSLMRIDGRLGSPSPTGPVLDHLCQVCEGEGDTCSVYCLCEGRGVITAELAREIAADDPDPRWQPRPRAAVPEYSGKRCGDCAFNAFSLERDAGTEAELFEGLNTEGMPFYCHAGMHHGAQGYVPRQRDRYGAPLGHPICAGWVREYERRAAKASRPSTEGEPLC